MRRLLLALALLPGCSTNCLQRMDVQQKFHAYGENLDFADGRSMRPLVPGTVPREHQVGSLTRWSGMQDAGFVKEFPVAVTSELLQRGRRRFEITCATCHGLIGDGDSVVATKMSLRPPPSLLTLGDRAPGFFYEVISQGYGLMPSYSVEISPEERWAVVAYLQALQLSQAASLRDAPKDVQAKLLQEAVR